VSVATVPTMRDVLLAIRSGSLEPPPAALLVGLRIVEVTHGGAAFGLTPSPDHLNADGTVNGGLLATLVDFALCSAVNDVDATAAVATAGLSITYQRPVTLATGEVVANAHVLHRTGRTASVEVRVTDEQGLLHAQAMGTVVVSRQAAVAG
jgi:uncharacterized protein (TIGR00369 family)